MNGKRKILSERLDSFLTEHRHKYVIKEIFNNVMPHGKINAKNFVELIHLGTFESGHGLSEQRRF